MFIGEVILFGSVRIFVNSCLTILIIGSRMIDLIALLDVVRRATTGSESSNTSCLSVMLRKLLGVSVYTIHVA